MAQPAAVSAQLQQLFESASTPTLSSPLEPFFADLLSSHSDHIVNAASDLQAGYRSLGVQYRLRMGQNLAPVAIAMGLETPYEIAWGGRAAWTRDNTELVRRKVEQHATAVAEELDLPEASDEVKGNVKWVVLRVIAICEGGAGFPYSSTGAPSTTDWPVKSLVPALDSASEEWRMTTKQADQLRNLLPPVRRFLGEFLVGLVRQQGSTSASGAPASARQPPRAGSSSLSSALSSPRSSAVQAVASTSAAAVVSDVRRSLRSQASPPSAYQGSSSSATSHAAATGARGSGTLGQDPPFASAGGKGQDKGKGKAVVRITNPEPGHGALHDKEDGEDGEDGDGDMDLDENEDEPTSTLARKSVHLQSKKPVPLQGRVSDADRRETGTAADATADGQPSKKRQISTHTKLEAQIEAQAHRIGTLVVIAETLIDVIRRVDPNLVPPVDRYLLAPPVPATGSKRAHRRKADRLILEDIACGQSLPPWGDSEEHKPKPNMLASSILADRGHFPEDEDEQVPSLSLVPPPGPWV
ncbi:hypothetical protein JCM11641_005133 [Rhodosporidiobolus odoratus]